MKKMILKNLSRAAMTMLLMVMTTAPTWAETVNVSYIDADGSSKNVDATVLESMPLGSEGTDSWYVVTGSNNVLIGQVNCFGNVHLIMADGATLTVSGGILCSDLYIYGQSEGTGVLNVNATSANFLGAGIYSNGTVTINGGTINGSDLGTGSGAGIFAETAIIVNGGTVNINDIGDGIGTGLYANGSVIVNGGTVITNENDNGSGDNNGTAIFAVHDFIINGGTVTACGTTGISTAKGYTTLLGGRITASSYEGTVVIGKDRIFTDGTNTYRGTLTDEQKAAIAGKTLWRAYQYIDENGDEQVLLDVTDLTGGGDTSLGTDNQENWFVVSGSDVIYTGTLSLNGDARLILCDGAKLTVVKLYAPKRLTIYGQSRGTGTLIAESGDDAIKSKGDLHIFGGNINATVTNDQSSYPVAIFVHGEMYITGGSVNAISHYDGILAHNVIIEGGTLNANVTGTDGAAINVGDLLIFYGGMVSAISNGSDGISAGNSILLGRSWMTTDYIIATSYKSPNIYVNDVYGVLSDGVNSWGPSDVLTNDQIANKVLTAPTCALKAMSYGGSEYWTSFYHSLAAYQVPTDAKAYIASLNNNKVTLKEIEGGFIPAGQAVILKSDAEDITLQRVVSGDDFDFTTNGLLGTMAKIENPGKAYMLDYKAEKGVGFYKLSEDDMIGANKAYLTYDGTTAPEFFGLTISETEDIEIIQHSESTVKGYFNLNGQRVAQPVKGLYIVNGKKVIIR